MVIRIINAYYVLFQVDMKEGHHHDDVRIVRIDTQSLHDWNCLLCCC